MPPPLAPVLSTRAKIVLLGSLYVAQGLPFGFFSNAVPAILRRSHVSLLAIAGAGLLNLPWGLKFLWAPLVDRYDRGALGPRRTWILALQALAVVLGLVLAGVDPGHAVLVVSVATLVFAFLAATQDIPTDALAVDLLGPQERGLGNGVQVAGYRIGMIVGGAGLLTIYDRLGWRETSLALAVLIGLCSLPVLAYREPRRTVDGAPRTAVPLHDRPHVPLSRALAASFARPGMPAWIAMVAFYKFGESIASLFFKPFVVDAGLSLTQLGAIDGLVGSTFGMLGALAGGATVHALGRRRALGLFGFAQTATIAAYTWVALTGPGAYGFSTFAVLAGIEHLAGGMATAALFTAMMDVCRTEHAASDYTAQACVQVGAKFVAGILAGAAAPWIGGYRGVFVMGVVTSGLAAAWAWTAYDRLERAVVGAEVAGS